MAKSGVAASDSFKSAYKTEKDKDIVPEDKQSGAPVHGKGAGAFDNLVATLGESKNISVGGIPTDDKVSEIDVAAPDILDDTTEENGNISLGDEPSDEDVTESSASASVCLDAASDFDCFNAAFAFDCLDSASVFDCLDALSKKKENLRPFDDKACENGAEIYDCIDDGTGEIDDLPPCYDKASESEAADIHCLDTAPEEEEDLPPYEEIESESGAADVYSFDTAPEEEANLPPYEEKAEVKEEGEKESLLCFRPNERANDTIFQQRRGAQFAKCNGDVFNPYSAVYFPRPSRAIPKVEETSSEEEKNKILLGSIEDSNSLDWDGNDIGVIPPGYGFAFGSDSTARENENEDEVNSDKDEGKTGEVDDNNSSRSDCDSGNVHEDARCLVSALNSNARYFAVPSSGMMNATFDRPPPYTENSGRETIRPPTYRNIGFSDFARQMTGTYVWCVGAMIIVVIIVFLVMKMIQYFFRK